MSALDAEFAALISRCRREGFAGVDINIRADGRVYVEVLDAGSLRSATAHGDLLPGGPLPTLSVAIEAACVALTTKRREKKR